MQGSFLVALDDLVLADQLGEPDEGFILYLEIDTERTTLGRDNTSVIVINNNATLVIIPDGKCCMFYINDYAPFNIMYMHLCIHGFAVCLCSSIWREFTHKTCRIYSIKFRPQVNTSPFVQPPMKYTLPSN